MPGLRFRGFYDAWEQRKLSDLTERVTRKNKNNESSRPLTISAQNGLIDQNDFFGKQIASRDVSGYFLVKNGEFAYNKSYSNGYPWGVIKRLDNYDMGVLSTLYIVFRPINISSQFLVYYYDTSIWHKEIAKNAAEGARNHGLLNITPVDFFGTSLVIPNSIEEQQKIGLLFKQLDNLITQNEHKLDLLKQLKQAYLQQIFSQELRFAGFNDTWEQRKLGKIGNTFNGLTGKTKEDFGHGDAKFVTYLNVFQNELATLKQLDSVEIDERQNQVQKGDVFFTTSSETPEEVGMSSVWTYDIKNIYLNSFTFGYRPTMELDLEYLATMLRSPSVRKKITFLAQGISRYNISKSKMMKIEVPIPNIFEQENIGSLFKQLDNLITLNQQKVNLLKKQKQAYLQKMFN